MVTGQSMVRYRRLPMLPIAALGIICSNFLGFNSYAATNEIGEKGASVYCFMRDSGNNHEVSWDAAYQIIKRQKSSIFKTSPKHGAVMITEAVVQNPDKFDNCGSYLGDLFAPTDLNVITEEAPKDEPIKPSEVKKGDRYSY